MWRPGTAEPLAHVPFAIAAISYSCPKERARSRPPQELNLCLGRTESFRPPMESTGAWVEATAWADAQAISLPGFFRERHADTRTVIPKSTAASGSHPTGFLMGRRQGQRKGFPPFQFQENPHLAFLNSTTTLGPRLAS
jgi:hypothetical protein